jgi:hypothetical protein
MITTKLALCVKLALCEGALEGHSQSRFLSD